MRDGERATDVPSELVALQYCSRGREIVTRIQFIVANEFKNSTVVSVRARLRRCIEERPTAIELCRIRALLHAELLQCVDRSLDKRASLMLFANIDTVQQKRDRASSNTADSVSIHYFGTDCQ